MRIVFSCAFALAGNGAVIGAPFSFDEIEFWVGEGANRAALVIDWVEGSTERPALAWGFRWDGLADGRDMLLSIVASDPRLFVKLGGSMANPALYGVGYDANDDGEFSIRDGTQFDSSGIAYGSAPFFGTSANDENDYYAEGWTFAFWHYGIATSNPYDGGSWTDSGGGMASRELVDGSWDGWVFTPTFDFGAFAENPVAAPPPDALSGDFNGDHRVDAADYVVWRKSDELPQEYDVWRNNFGATTHAGASSALNIPEPMAVWPLFACLLTQLALYRNRR